MSDVIGGVARAAVEQDGQLRPEGGAGKEARGRSFESVLRQEQNGAGDQKSTEAVAGGASQPSAPTGVSGAGLERMRAELADDLNRITPADASTDFLKTDFFAARTRLGFVREAMGGVVGSPHEIDLRSRFAGVESEWRALEGIMASDKELSTGELLGLQARMYQVSQHIEVMSKVVDQVTGGIKTVLNTNV